MANFNMNILAVRDTKGKFKELEAGREYLLKIKEDAD